LTGLTIDLLPAWASGSRVANPIAESKPPDQIDTTRSGLSASTCSAGTSKFLFIVNPPFGRAEIFAIMLGSSETP
jgi:hypothetical protein